MMRETFDYACVMISLPKYIRQEIGEFNKFLIPDSVLWFDPQNPKGSNTGRVSDSHITALYGIQQDDIDTQVQEVLKRASAKQFTLHKLGVFEAEDHDVVIIKAQGDDLFRLNQVLTEEFPDHYNVHGDYKPHLTLAYVKKGEGQKILDSVSHDENEFEVEVPILAFIVTKRDGKRVKIFNYFGVEPGDD